MEIVGTTKSYVRYPTLDDWRLVGDGIFIPYLETGVPESNLLIFVHALVEAFLCQRHGVSERTVTDFDRQYTGNGEPGDEVNCPYKDEHHAAMLAEKYLARLLEYDWKMHNINCEKTFVKNFGT